MQQVVKYRHRHRGARPRPAGRRQDRYGDRVVAEPGVDDYVSSAWFVGYTPQLATAVMYVRGKGQGQLDGWLPEYFGGSYPARTWTDVMTRDLDGTEVEEFPPPANLDGEAPDDGHAPYTPPPQPTKKPTTKPTKKPTQAPPKPSKTPSPTARRRRRRRADADADADPHADARAVPPTAPPPPRPRRARSVRQRRQLGRRRVRQG